MLISIKDIEDAKFKAAKIYLSCQTKYLEEQKLLQFKTNAECNNLLIYTGSELLLIENWTGSIKFS